MASRAKKLEAVIDGKNVYVMANGLRVGPRGRVQAPYAVSQQLDKGTRRRMRRELASAGRTDLMRATLGQGPETI